MEFHFAEIAIRPKPLGDLTTSSLRQGGEPSQCLGLAARWVVRRVPSVFADIADTSDSGHNSGMLLTRKEIPILIANAIYIPIFTIVALLKLNYEFLLYVVVVLIVAAWILWKQRTLRFDPPILWGLTLWGLLHMAGGNIRVGEGVLYEVQLIPVVLRYDQFVHIFGFGIATLLCYHVLRPYLRSDIARWGTLSILMVLMGSGLGAVNEIIEFVAEKTLKETGVGGYDNTLLDMVSNLIGGILAVAFLAWRRRETTVTRQQEER